MSRVIRDVHQDPVFFQKRRRKIYCVRDEKEDGGKGRGEQEEDEARTVKGKSIGHDPPMQLP